MAMLTQVHHDLFPDEPGASDNDNLHDESPRLVRSRSPRASRRHSRHRLTHYCFMAATWKQSAFAAVSSRFSRSCSQRQHSVFISSAAGVFQILRLLFQYLKSLKIYKNGIVNFSFGMHN